jgi:ubiquinone/menaquinone biosynthesis C-methylase UbiE
MDFISLLGCSLPAALRRRRHILENNNIVDQSQEVLLEEHVPDFDVWESAYLSFETPEEEIQKFIRRLTQLGAKQWPRDAAVVELFCGRGNGLHALQRLGFRAIEGVDLSPRLLRQYKGYGRLYEGDCRHLPFADRSKDVLIVQGGLHHLNKLPDDLKKTFAEMQRVLSKDGRVVIVEPWLTPFLRLVHATTGLRIARASSAKLRAFATMVENERPNYDAWLRNPLVIRSLSRACFRPVYESFRWGKWSFVGKPL